MSATKKLKLKRFYFHPITIFIILTIFIVLVSSFLSLFEMQATYNIINENTKELEPVLITVENLLSFKNIKYLISNAISSFLSFAPLGTLLISLIGLSIAEASGFIEAFTKRYLIKMPNWLLTFIVIFISTISSLINEVGYAILIPLVALIYFIKNRNPILGIVTTFAAVSFGYGVSIFVGSTDINLVSYTQSAAHLIDEGYHVGVSSNLYFIIVTTLILTIVGTIIVENILVKRIGKYKKEEDFSKTEQYRIINYEEEEQLKIEKEQNETKGLINAFIVGVIILLIYLYQIIPGLPSSGLLLDMSKKVYVDQLFGENAFFQSSFTYLVSILFIFTGLTYGITSKTIKSDKELIEEASSKFKNIGSIIILLFVVSQFISVYKQSNIGLVITTWLANSMENLELSGIVLILTALLLIAISNLFLTSTSTKWMIFSPIMVPMFMQSNITPEFSQVIMRSGMSMTNGITPIMASFVIYIGYLNIYNLNKLKPYSIKKAIKLLIPYFLIIGITWILIVIGWYIIGLPIGINSKSIL